MQCPTNLDPSFDKSPPNDYKCNLCNKCGDHYATVCKKNMNPTSLNQQRKWHARHKYNSISRRDRSHSPLREPKDRCRTGRERSPYRASKDGHHHDRESSPYRVLETRYHVDRDRSRERYRRSRSGSRHRSPSPPRQGLRRRDRHRNNKIYRTKHSSPEPNFEEADSFPPPQFGALDYDDGFEPMPYQPYRSLLSRPADVKIRGRGSSLYYDDNGEGSVKPPAYGNEDLMSRKRRRSETPAPHQDDHLGRSTVDKEFFLSELTDLVATTAAPPRPQAPMKNRLPEVFKNDLKQPSWSWAIEPTANNALIKPEPVPEVVREPSPPVELGITEKRLDGYRAPQYHPAILELFKDRKNVWIHKIDKTKRLRASSFFSDNDLEENNMDALAHPGVAVDLESIKDTVMTEAEPVAAPMDEADAVNTAENESEPASAVMTDDCQRVDSTSTTDVVMGNSLTTHIVHHEEANSSIHQPGEDSRVDLMPADDVVMEDADPLGVPEAAVAHEGVDVSAIVEKIIADMGLPEAENTIPEPVEEGSLPVESETKSETLFPAQKTVLVQEKVNAASAESADMAIPEAAETAPTPVHKLPPPVESALSPEIFIAQKTVLVQETINEALAASADVVPEVEPNHAPTVDDNEDAAPDEATQDTGDNISSDTVIKDVIYVKTDLEPAKAETSQPEEQGDVIIPDGSQTQ